MPYTFAVGICEYYHTVVTDVEYIHTTTQSNNPYLPPPVS